MNARLRMTWLPSRPMQHTLAIGVVVPLSMLLVIITTIIIVIIIITVITIIKGVFAVDNVVDVVENISRTVLVKVPMRDGHLVEGVKCHTAEVDSKVSRWKKKREKVDVTEQREL